MSRTSLKETFDEPNITEELVLESGFLDEQISSIIGQIVDKQLKKFIKKGRMSLSKGAVETLKKLNKLGVKKFSGFDLDKAIPALEDELKDGTDDEDLISVLQKAFSKDKSDGQKGKRYPIMKGGRVVGWRTRKESMNPAKYRLSSLFLEQLEVEKEDELGYSDQTPGDVDYVSKSVEPSNEIPETPLGDAADERVEVSPADVVAALTQDNARYGEFDEALED